MNELQNSEFEMG